jgi:hypothetical protein
LMSRLMRASSLGLSLQRGCGIVVSYQFDLVLDTWYYYLVGKEMGDRLPS